MIACAGLLGTAILPQNARSETALPPRGFEAIRDQITAPLEGAAKSPAPIPSALRPDTPRPSLAVINPDTEGLTAVDLGRYRLADDITSAPINGTLCLDLQQTLTALDFPIVVDRSKLVATGWFVRESQTVNLDLVAPAARVGDLPIPLSPNSVAMLSTGPCMTLPALAKIFSLELEYNPNGSLVLVSSKETLPLVDRLQRQARTKLRTLSYNETQTPRHIPSLPYRAFVAPNSDVRLSLSTQKVPGIGSETALSWSSLSVGEFAFMTAEAQLSGTEKGLIGDVSRLRLYRSERDGGVFGISKLTEVSVGDIAVSGSGLGGSGGVGLGAGLSTFPVNRPASFDRTDFQGALPVGWDVELYRNGQLLDFENKGESGGYAFKDVPVLLGDNAFEIVLYGPQGQRRVISKRINASSFLAPKGAAYYRAALYQDEPMFSKARADAAARLDLRAAIGLTNNFNLGFGFESYEKSGKRVSITTLAGQTSLYGAAINTEMAISEQGALAGQIEFQGSKGQSGLRGRLILAQEDFVSERISNQLQGRLELGLDRRLEFKGLKSGTLSGQVRVDQFHNGDQTLTARERLTLAFGNAFLTQSLNWTKTSSGERRDLIEGDVAYSQRQGRFGLRASANYEISPTPQITRINAVVERALAVSASAWRWRAETSWATKEKEFNYSFGMYKNFRSFNFDVSATTNGRDTYGISMGLTFSLGRTGAGWGMTALPLAQSGTIRAQLFEDMDEDGRFSPGDLPVKGAGLLTQSAHATAISDAKGIATLSGVDLNAIAQLNVLTDDLDDGSLYAPPSYSAPREGTVSLVQIPLGQVGVVEGLVTMVSGFESVTTPLGGVVLSLLDKTDKEIARTVSAYDGYYAFEAVPVGQYSVALAGDTALASRVRQVELVRLATNRKAPDAQGLTLTLVDKDPTFMPLRGFI